ncbi:methyl-accepting chemotaxis protein [Salibacterium aidingense]|uniref:methyl-accepting chemotaxis protein n=1 Tax=Salibacterium aidingense TaxID=384933 RepID=UPI003BE695B4
MSIKKKLFINTLTTVVLAAVIIAFIIFNMMQIQSSSEDQVDALVTIEEFKSQTNAAQQNLSSFSTTQTEELVQDTTTSIEATEELLDQLDDITVNEESREYITRITTKFEGWKEATLQVLNAEDGAAADQQASRLAGIENDVYMLQLFAEASYDQAQEALDQQVQFIIMASVVSVLLLIVISLVVSNRITSPITKTLRRLADHSNEVASGNLAIEPISYQKKDELGQLNDSFQQMIEQIRLLLQSIQSVSERVEGFAGQIENENAAVTEINQQVASSTDELAQGTQTIASDLQDSVTKVEDMDKAFTSNVDYTKHSVQYGEEAIEAVQSGKAALEKQRTLVQENKETTESIKAATQSFVESTKKIHTMADSVSDIASQTNLLALNAAIEASRAGEAGKGFAVVAEEVRKLAEQTTKETTRISDMVGSIEEGIEAVTAAVDRGVSISAEEQTSMETTNISFEDIHQKVTSITEKLEELMQSMEHSKGLGSDVLENVESISSVVEETAAENEEISSSAQEQLGAFRHVVDKVTELRALTDELNGTVKKFTL